MKNWLRLFPLMCLMFAPMLQAADQCVMEHVPKRAQRVGPWIDQDNWLAPEYLRFGLQPVHGFMPMLKIRTSAAPIPLKAAPKPLVLDKIKSTDPLDQQPRDLAFLLDTRLYADGLVVIRNGQVVSEQYWHGLSPEQPRLLLGATRPFLSMMGAMAVAQGKLMPDRSIIRHVAALSSQTGLRKLSIQRLLEANTRFEWTAQELNEWYVASGWMFGKEESDARAWLQQPERWTREFADAPNSTADLFPDGDLLAWALAESYQEPLSQVFCDNVLARLRPENPVVWLTDQRGTELSGGLGFSLRDFARFGQLLIETRNNRNRSKIPSWFIETLTASSGMRKTSLSNLVGFSNGSELRYGFVHLGGAPNRIAILGPHGNSLYVDFDSRLVIGLFAAYPRDRNPAMLATLEQVWESLGLATQPARKR